MIKFFYILIVSMLFSLIGVSVFFPKGKAQTKVNKSTSILGHNKASVLINARKVKHFN